MIAAAVDLADGCVANVIVIDSLDDPAPPGTMLVAVPDGQSVDVTCTWSADAGFGAPVPPTLDPGLEANPGAAS
jgi:hypothetical protein